MERELEDGEEGVRGKKTDGEERKGEEREMEKIGRERKRRPQQKPDLASGTMNQE